MPMPLGVKVQHQARHDELDRYNQLRDVASTLFFCNGYRAVSLRSLAAHIGLSSGSLYSHIDSKQNLLFELVEESLELRNLAARAAVAKYTRRGGCPLEGFVAAVITNADAQRQNLVIAWREEHNLSAEQKEKVRVLNQRYEGILRALITHQFHNGHVSETSITAIARSVLNVLAAYLYLPANTLATAKAIKVYTAMAQAAISEMFD